MTVTVIVITLNRPECVQLCLECLAAQARPPEQVIVVDASALLELLLQTPLGTRVEARLFRDQDEFHSPHLVDVEVTQGLRRLVRVREVSPDRAAEAIADLADLDLHRHPHLDLLTRAWKLRENVTAYDAMYVAWQRRSMRRSSPATTGSPKRQVTGRTSK